MHVSPAGQSLSCEQEVALPVLELPMLAPIAASRAPPLSPCDELQAVVIARLAAIATRSSFPMGTPHRKMRARCELAQVLDIKGGHSCPQGPLPPIYLPLPIKRGPR